MGHQVFVETAVAGLISDGRAIEAPQACKDNLSSSRAEVASWTNIFKVTDSIAPMLTRNCWECGQILTIFSRVSRYVL